jgi:esterase/lipase
VRSHEAATPFLKPDNEARIIWADSVPQKTKYVILYLPGYSGTYYEGEPLHKEIAERYHANLYLPRLHSHGVQPLEPFLDITAENYVQSAREALAVANQLGDSVILMSTSTGGTLSLILASEHHPKIAALVMFSPNIEIFFGAAKLLDKPWGLQIARLVYGGKYHEWKVYEDYIQNYWTTRYRLEGLVQLQALLSRTMVPETFHEVNKPVFLGYYYESESAQDSTVSVAAMKQMYKELATPESLKTQHAFGNAKAHVIACKKRSGAFAEVKQATTQFLDNILDK